jgi:fatty-acyl-CoA synthase
VGFFDAIARETSYLRTGIRLTRRVRDIKPDSTFTTPDLLEQWVRKTPDAPAIYFEDRVISWKAFDQGAARYARWAMAQGIGRGDAVAILMENRPEFLMAWCGLNKIGAIGALINTHQSAAPLAHSLNISGARHLVLGAELAGHFASARDRLETPMTVWASGGQVEGAEDLDAVLAETSPAPIPRPFRDGLTCADKALYIYTSGTTGMPKAANISHLRMQMMMQAFSVSTSATAKDIMYVVLPLYHTSGGICAIGAVFAVGGAVVLRRKFSVSHFWEDCAKYKPTLFQYIGELCRYLLNAPPHPLETAHSLRLIIGNGLRPEIWPTFKSRFKIPKIVEFYGATEGNVALLNFDGKVGAVGRIPGYMRKRMPIHVIKFDVENEQPIRDPVTGFCVECAPGEVGEAAGKIDAKEPRTSFEGYSKGTETEKKLLRDVFEKGDVYFRTGDLLKRDALGYFYFVDRIGDTFRWKGENVATSEVAEALSLYPGVKEANVYGVKLGSLDGKAGMAAIVAGPELDLAGLPAYLEGQLAAYARPLFLRLLQSEMEITGTFKHRKVELVKEGFDPAAVTDPIYWLDPESKSYKPLDAATHASLIAGEVKL